MIIWLDSSVGFAIVRLHKEKLAVTERVGDIFVEFSEAANNQTIVSAFHVLNRMDLLQLPAVLKTLRQSGFPCAELTQKTWDETRKACAQVGDLALELS